MRITVSWQIVLVIALLISAATVGIVSAGTLSCTIRASTCNGGEVNVYEMQSTLNSHAGLSSAAYSNLVCCTGVTGLGNSCSGTYATVLKLSGATDAHVRQGTLADYPSATNACLSVNPGDIVSVGYQATNCAGFDTMLGSMIGTTNSHVGGSAWTNGTTKICASAQNTIVSVSVSDGVVSYGSLATNATASTRSPLDTQTLTNTGNVPEDFSINGQNAIGSTQNWTLAATAGNAQYVHGFCTSSCTTPPTNYVALTTTPQLPTAFTNIGTGNTANFDLFLNTPTVTTDFTSHAVDVTITASAH